jgi:hypothetical protein
MQRNCHCALTDVLPALLLLPRSQDEGTSNANMYGVAVADATTAWAVGSRGIIKRYSGSTWAVERQPEVGASALRAVAAPSSQKAWAGGSECGEAAAAYHAMALSWLLCVPLVGYV